MLTLDRKMIGGLKAILRFHFIERVTQYFDQLPEGGMQSDPRYRALGIVALVDAQDDLLEGARLVEAALDLTSSNEGTVPVKDDLYDILKTIIDRPIATSRFETLTNEEIDGMLAPLRAIQDELRGMFAGAEHVDLAKLPRFKYASVGVDPEGKGSASLLN